MAVNFVRQTVVSWYPGAQVSWSPGILEPRYPGAQDIVGNALQGVNTQAEAYIGAIEPMPSDLVDGPDGGADPDISFSLKSADPSRIVSDKLAALFPHAILRS